jgi:chromosome segregation ATPase
VEGLIFEVCKDLQYRCENAEQPLRTAQAENGNLTERLRNVEEHVRATPKESDRLSHELFEKSHEADQHVAQSERLGRELADMRQLCTNMSSEISALKEELKCAYREHANCLENQHLQAQEHAAETYRCHAAKVSELEAQLRAKTSAESSLESELAWLKEEMSRTQEEMVAAHRTAITHLEQQHRLECTSWQKQIDTLEQRLSSQGAELLQAKSDVSSEQTKAQDKSKELDEAREDLHTWQQDLENQKARVSQMEAAAETAKADVEELFRQQEGYEADRLGLAARAKELEKSEAALRKQCLVYQTALEKAKEAEQRVLAIFQGNRHPRASSVASAATATPSRLLLTPTQRLPEYSFASEDDEDYPEVLKLK